MWTTAYSVINYPAVARETERSTATPSSSPANTKLPVPIAKVPKTPAPEIEAPKAYPSAPVRSNDRNRTTVRAWTLTGPEQLRGVIMGMLDRRGEESCCDR